MISEESVKVPESTQTTTTPIVNASTPKTQFVSFRISSEESKQFEMFAKFLHERNVIKFPSVACLARSILFNEINKFARFLEEAQLADLEKKRQLKDIEEYNKRLTIYPFPKPTLKPL